MCYVNVLRAPLVSRDLPEIIRTGGALASNYLAFDPAQFMGHTNDDSDLDVNVSDADSDDVASEHTFSDSAESQSDSDYDWVCADEGSAEMTGSWCIDQ
jgi:hypothetical protein